MMCAYEKITITKISHYIRRGKNIHFKRSHGGRQFTMPSHYEEKKKQGTPQKIAWQINRVLIHYATREKENTLERITSQIVDDAKPLNRKRKTKYT